MRESSRKMGDDGIPGSGDLEVSITVLEIGESSRLETFKREGKRKKEKGKRKKERLAC